MATGIVTQMFADVKRETAADSAAISAQLSPELIEREGSVSARYTLAPTIFKGDMAMARELMNFMGGAVFIPHTDYTTMEQIANFYGVKTKYMRGLFYRHGIVHQKMPADVLKIPGCEVEASLKSFDDVCVEMECSNARRRNYTFSQKPLCSKTKVSVAAKGVPCFYSARVFLATASLMYYGSVVPKDSMASKVMEVLQRSGYYAEAAKIAAENKDRFKKALKVSGNSQGTGTEGVKVATSGEVVIPPEVFVQVIKLAVKEAVTDVVSAIFPNIPPTAGDKTSG